MSYLPKQWGAALAASLIILISGSTAYAAFPAALPVLYQIGLPLALWPQRLPWP